MGRQPMGRQPMGCLYSFVAFLRLLILGGGRPWGLWVEAGGGEEAAHGLPLLFPGVSKSIDFGRREAVGPVGRGRRWGQPVERQAIGRSEALERQPMGCLYSFVAFLRLLILGGARPWGLWVEAGRGRP